MSTLVIGALLLVMQNEAEEVKVHLKGLRSESLQEREQAGKSLKALGRVALPGLERAAKGVNPALANRAKRILGELTYLKRPSPKPSSLRLMLTKDRLCTIQNRVYCDFKSLPQKGVMSKLEDCFMARHENRSWSRKPPKWESSVVFTDAHPETPYGDLRRVWSSVVVWGKIPRIVLESSPSSLYAWLRFEPIPSGEGQIKLGVTLVMEEQHKAPVCEIRVGEKLEVRIPLPSREKDVESALRKGLRSASRKTMELVRGDGSATKPVIAVFDADAKIPVRHVLATLSSIQGCGIEHIQVSGLSDEAK